MKSSRQQCTDESSGGLPTGMYRHLLGMCLRMVYCASQKGVQMLEMNIWCKFRSGSFSMPPSCSFCWWFKSLLASGFWQVPKMWRNMRIDSWRICGRNAISQATNNSGMSSRDRWVPYLASTANDTPTRNFLLPVQMLRLEHRPRLARWDPSLLLWAKCHRMHFIGERIQDGMCWGCSWFRRSGCQHRWIRGNWRCSYWSKFPEASARALMRNAAEANTALTIQLSSLSVDRFHIRLLFVQQHPKPLSKVRILIKHLSHFVIVHHSDCFAISCLERNAYHILDEEAFMDENLTFLVWILFVNSKIQIAK